LNCSSNEKLNNQKTTKKVKKFALLSDYNGVPSPNNNGQFYNGLLNGSSLTADELCVELLTAASNQNSLTKH